MRQYVDVEDVASALVARFWKRPAFRVLPTMSQAAITGPSRKSSISSAELCPALR